MLKKATLASTMPDFVLRCSATIRMLPHHETAENDKTLLPGEEVVNVDETGHKEKGRRLWTWCFRADLYTLFRIDPSRSSQVLIDTLGEEFDGVLGCDYFSAYRKTMGRLLPTTA